MPSSSSAHRFVRLLRRRWGMLSVANGEPRDGNTKSHHRGCSRRRVMRNVHVGFPQDCCYGIQRSVSMLHCRPDCIVRDLSWCALGYHIHRTELSCARVTRSFASDDGVAALRRSSSLVSHSLILVSLTPALVRTFLQYLLLKYRRSIPFWMLGWL
jgi:hypothetical protein